MISTKTNSNYLAKIFRIKNLRKHSNADRLQCVSVDFQNVITDLRAKENDCYIFFPVGAQIDEKLLSFLDAFQDPEKNLNKVKGYFGKNGVVKATNLRSEKSEGFIIPIRKIEEFYGISGLEEFENQYLDTINGNLVCWKYERPVQFSGSSENKKTREAKKQCSRLVDNQFHLHDDTEQLGRNIDKFDLYDEISITYKLHGENICIGRVRVKRKLSLIDKICKFLGAKIEEEEYPNQDQLPLYASRGVIRNNLFVDDEFQCTEKFNQWTELAKRYGDRVPKNFSIYGEIIGQFPNGRWVKEFKKVGFDYGLKPYTFDLFVFRVTFTNQDGQVFELGTEGSRQFCEKYGFKFVPIFFEGTIEEFLKNSLDKSYSPDDDSWKEDFVNEVKKKFNEKDCFMCENKLPEEGVVVVKQRLDKFEAYKQKSHRFIKGECEEIDSREFGETIYE